MTKVYAIYNKVKKGYLSENEDYIGGLDYEADLDEFTVYFYSKEAALENCDENEVVVEVEELR